MNDPRPPVEEPREPAIELRGVWLSFDGTSALEDVDLTLEQGGFLGVIGPNGGGKSVLLKVVMGLLEPDRGSVRVFGRRPEEARGEIGYVPQYAGFDRDFPVAVRDVVLTGRLRPEKLFRRLAAGDRQRAEEAMERVGMAIHADRQIGQLSGGQLQRVLIARALAVDARLLLLDEPTASLDVPGGDSVYDLLDELSPAITIVVVSHALEVMHRHVKTVACLNRRLHYHHSKEITQEMMEETYGCEVDFLVHRHTHRVLPEHDEGRP